LASPDSIFQGSPLEQLDVISNMRDSLQLSYPELETLVYEYQIQTMRIFPYLGYEPETPPKEDYLRSTLNALAAPLRDDYVRIALNALATPIREDYLRIALTNLATPIREDYLRLALTALAKPIREDRLRTALTKFKTHGYEAQSMVTEVSDIITGSDQFIKYSPLEIFDVAGEPKIRYIEIRSAGVERGEVVKVLDKELFEIPVKCIGGFESQDYSLFMNGHLGTDGAYVDHNFDTDAVEHIYLPVYDLFSPTKEKVPREYWITQARAYLNHTGWSMKNIRSLSWWNFRPYKGKKPSSKMISRLRQTLVKEFEKKNS
jgi:hypothetical protein